MSTLFTPIALRGLTLKNRVVISPMCQYSAIDGRANDWHFVHLGRFALGGAGLVIAEATAVAADGRGKDRAGRMRLPLEVARAVRAAWPAERPLFVRVSTTDYVEGGLTVEDTVAFARELKATGVDVADASSAGITGPATNAKIPRYYGHQVPFAERIRVEAGIATMAVGLIVTGTQAEAVLRAGQADLIAVGREALYDPNWALHAKAELEASPGTRSFEA
jgi:2,4-dienoyl-CoA reductase-like NADH-dependent reductase (Old Yellow Enzyme family)